jgi:excisionase family DNA binding protein
MTESTMEATTLVTMEKVAELFHVSPQTIKSWAAKGTFPQPFRQGRQWLFDAAEIRTHLEKLRTT